MNRSLQLLVLHFLPGSLRELSMRLLGRLLGRCMVHCLRNVLQLRFHRLLDERESLRGRSKIAHHLLLFTSTTSTGFDCFRNREVSPTRIERDFRASLCLGTARLFFSFFASAASAIAFAPCCCSSAVICSTIGTGEMLAGGGPAGEPGGRPAGGSGGPWPGSEAIARECYAEEKVKVTILHLTSSLLYCF